MRLPELDILEQVIADQNNEAPDFFGLTEDCYDLDRELNAPDERHSYLGED